MKFPKALFVVFIVLAVTAFLFGMKYNQNKISLSLKECDFHQFNSNYCEKGFICFEKGYDKACPRGYDCSKIQFKQVGDNKCHKECQTDSDCDSIQKCVSQFSNHGDTVTGGNMCR